MTTSFLVPSDVAWRRWLESAPAYDVYHLPEYVAISAKHEQCEPLAFFVEIGDSTGLVPLLSRRVAVRTDHVGPCYDVVTPYGYSTPILSSITSSSEFLRSFLVEFRHACRERGIVSAFFRLHPLLPLTADVLTEFGSLVKHGQTVSIDLRQSEEESGAQMRLNHRRDIDTLLQSGFFVQVDCWQHYEQFMTIYSGNMKRVDASKFYYFKNQYFYDLHAALGDRIHLFTVHHPSGQVAAAGLFTGVGDIVQYHLGGTAAEYLKLAPSKLMFDEVRRWARESSYLVFHLGGGLGATNDGLFRFKAGFSKRRHDFYTFRMITDEERYQELVERWEEQNGVSADTVDYFPVYRAELH